MDDVKTVDAKREEAAKSASGAHPDKYQGKSPLKVNKLGHFVYEVSDVERSARFWRDVMGFHETDRNDKGMVFLRCAGDHHAIGLVPSGSKSRPAKGSGLKVEHLALEVDNVEMLLKARDFLQKNNIPIVFEGRKGAGCNVGINFLDPDGFEFEVYCQMDQVDDSGRLRPADQFRRAGSLEEAIANPVQETW
jgi:catechol 2,3-dioxygenase-like lactoylglutathione lyase family enzyme